MSGKDLTAEDAAFARAALDVFMDTDALGWLAHPNIAGVMLGKKRSGGEETDEDAIVFRVDRKLDSRADILAIGSKPFPKAIGIGGKEYLTDVVEGTWRATLENAGVNPRGRFASICPGVSIGNAGVPGDFGTGTAIVRHRATGSLALLSCDHVIGRLDGNDFATQPGRGDTGSDRDVFGRVLARMRDRDGDAAIAGVERRPAEPRIAGLGIAPDTVAMPEVDDIVVKAGRTTGVTFGVVRSIKATQRVRYSDRGSVLMRGFVIEGLDGGHTQEGDSGAPWLLCKRASREPTSTLVGIHTASTPDTREAFACFATIVFARLDIELAGPLPAASASAAVDLLRVTARSGLVVRSGAGREFDRQQLLPLGTTVRRLGVHGDWTQVSLRDDLAADGFAYSPFLTPVSVDLAAFAEANPDTLS